VKNRMLNHKVTNCQSQRIGCVWKPGFVKSSHIYVADNTSLLFTDFHIRIDS